MIYREHNDLAIIQISEETDSVSFQEIEKALRKHPSSVIYCELEQVNNCNKLYGIVSQGDIYRSFQTNKKSVPINKKFTSINPDESMKARQIFKEKEVINAIPIIDQHGQLLGDYIRWDDVLISEYFAPFGENQYETEFWERNTHVALVKISGNSVKKEKMIDSWKHHLDLLGVQADIINHTDIEVYANKVDKIIFFDEDEKIGTEDYLRFTKYVYMEAFGKKSVTCKEINELIYYDKLARDVLHSYIENGVSVLAVHCNDNGSEYYQWLQKDIAQKFIDENLPVSRKLPYSARKDFYGELYTDEYAEEHSMSPLQVEFYCGYNRLKDISGKDYNVKSGERLTAGQPMDYDRTIYFFGPCLMIGNHVEDKHTIESFLQAKCNQMEIPAKVVNLGCWDSEENTLNRVIQSPMKEGDIIVIYLENEIDGLDNLNLADVLEQKNVPGKWFTNTPLHCNHKVTKIYADAIYEKIEKIFENPFDHSKEVQINSEQNLTLKLWMERYFSDFDPESYGSIGAIVMNCNPFTNGHRYLIERASNTVDFLIIFVVEEDKSFFSFAERFACVHDGVADLANVMAVPSGQFILSQNNFPEYFSKTMDENIASNAEYDIKLFAEQIAPKLHISYRFVGEEPEDVVTNEYNLAMKKILPPRGIKLIEIPRKEDGKGIISASRVRRCLEENDIIGLKELVPETTERILFKR